MNKFRKWYLEYQNEITWFVVGLMVANFVEHLAKGQYELALVDTLLAAINIYFWRRDRV
jgi:hypothetical protein